MTIQQSNLSTEPQIAQDTTSVTQPGATDPAEHYTSSLSHCCVSFRRNDFSNGESFMDMNVYSCDQNLNNLNLAVRTTDLNYISDEIVAAAGRIWDPSCDQVVYAQRIDSNSLAVTFVADPPMSQPSYVFSGFQTSLPYCADFMSIAVGDLDKVTDKDDNYHGGVVKDGNYHDEVVVAYASSQFALGEPVQVAVLDYTQLATEPPNPIAVTTAQTSHTLASKFYSNTGSDIFEVDNILGVAVGDFDGDGLKEIAVVYLTDATTMIVSMFRYTNDGLGNRSLKEVSSASRKASSQWVGTISVTAADFNGDGKDELLVGLSEWNTPSNDQYGQALGFDLWQADSNLNLTKTVALGGLGLYISNFSAHGNCSRIQVSPGLFKYDPTNGFDLNCRQFVACWNTPDGNLLLTTYEITTDEKKVPTAITQMNQVAYGGPEDFGLIYQRFSIAAGAYKGNDANVPLLWGVAVNVCCMYVPSPEEQKVTTQMFDNALNACGDDGSHQTPINLKGGERFPAVAFDLYGKSVCLGAPVHFTIDNLVNTDFILQEPPKHSFYDNRPTIAINGNQVNNPTYGQIITVSRYDSTNVALKTSTGTSFSGMSKDTSNWSIGASVDVSAKATATAGVPDVATAKLSVSAELKVGYDYNQNKENYNSYYSQRTISESDQTDHDDFLKGRLQTLDIWRYRVYGVSATDPQGNPTNAFYEVILPGPTLDFSGSGLDFDWYQPTYENGNILSYPQPSNNTFTPPDLGSYKIPCPNADGSGCNPDGTMTVTGVMVGNRETFFDGTSGSLVYDYTNTTGSGNSVSYSHTLAESLDVKVSYKVKVGTDDEGASYQGSVDLNFHNSNSWGNTSTSDTTTTSDTGITLNRSSGDATQAYAFYPVFYTTQDGTIKVAHAVNVLGSSSGKAFWAEMYGRKADPALNLPLRFTPAYGPTGALTGWAANTQTSRKQMRGFFLRCATSNPVTNTYDLLASAPLAGQTVRLDATVYNFSTAVAVNRLTVRFQIIGYDSKNYVEIPFSTATCPAGCTFDANTGRCTLLNNGKETTITQLNPLGIASATFDWDTTGFGPGDYRIYVVLNPDNIDNIDETYPAEDPTKFYEGVVDANGKPIMGVDPGQNNEGFGYVTILNPNYHNNPGAAFSADVSMKEDSLAACNAEGELEFKKIKAAVFRPLPLRAKVYSDLAHTANNHLLVYDGDPEKDGKLIAGKIIHTGNTEGACVWFEWIPTQLGEHTLYAKVLERRDDPHKGNNMSTLKVVVVPAQAAD
jgi:hypothetical protein